MKLIKNGALILAMFLLVVNTDASAAQTKKHKTYAHKKTSQTTKHASRTHKHNKISYKKVLTDRFASLVVDAKTGNVVEAENADKLRYPASLTKLMTLYLTFEALNNNKINLDQFMDVSRHASSQPRMSIDLRPNDRITVRDAIASLVVVSANDAAVVLAEKVGGSESNFANKMTSRARQLGMDNTTFANASGLHDKNQVTTAKDMAKLMMAIKRDFPQYFEMLSLKQFAYNGRVWDTHNHLIKDYKWATAGKTGFVRQSGFNLVLNAEKGNKDLVGVVMGGTTARSRDLSMVRLLEDSFRRVSGSPMRTASNAVSLSE